MDENTTKPIIDKAFISIDKNHAINIKIEHEFANFEIIKFDNNKIITFLNLLKTICEFMGENNIKNIIQTINRNDYKLFNRSKIISDIAGLENIVIMTPSNVFIFEIMDALGISELRT